MENVKFDTIKDAEIAFVNSGMYETFAEESEKHPMVDDIIEYLYRNSDNTCTMDDIVEQYLIENGHNVSDYPFFDPQNKNLEW